MDLIIFLVNINKELLKTSIYKVSSVNLVNIKPLVFDYNINKELLKTSIYKVLLMHQGVVRKFSLLYPSSNRFSNIETWIVFLSNKNVQELSLAFLICFRLPSHLFKFSGSKAPGT